MNAQPRLFDQLAAFEGLDVEYKSARGGLPGSLWATYSAFANTEGGTVWLGIRQQGDHLELEGLAEPEKMLQDFWNTVNNRSKVNLNVLQNSDVQIVYPGNGSKALMCIQVPRADRRQRPVYVGLDPMQGTYRRNNEGDYRCNESEVRRMYADQAEEPADSRILDGFSMADLHLESLRQYRQLFGLRGAHPWLTEDDAGLLVKLGGWRRDRRSGQEGLTLAGLLMFGRHEAIRDPAAVPGFQLDYRERFSDDPAVRWTDRLTLDGSWEGNLFQFYQQVKLKLSTGPGIKRPFVTDADGYRSASTPVTDALQEALVNALIHADYAGQGGIVIDRWLNRMAFSNPGTLLIAPEQLWRGGISECRNKSLQLMFQMLGVGDKAGSGMDEIRTSWAVEHWQPPGVRETLRPDRVTLDLPMVSLLPDEVLQALRLQFGSDFDRLCGDEVQAVVTARLEGQVTNRRLQEMLTLHRVDIGQMLASLVNQGFLSSEGVGRGTRYFVMKAQTPPASEGTPPVKSGTSPVSAGTPPVKSGGSPVKDTGTLPAHQQMPLESIPSPDAEAASNQALLKVRSSQRVRPQVMRAAILHVCKDGFFTAQQVAEQLNRSTGRLQEEFLTPLSREGLLRLRHPDNLNHPQQAYMSQKQNPQEGQAS